MFNFDILLQSMPCTLGKLLWFKLPGKQCDGTVTKIRDIEDIDESVEPILFTNKCLGDKQCYTTLPSKFDLLSNRLSPYSLTKSDLGSIDVCQSHYVSIFSLFCSVLSSLATAWRLFSGFFKFIIAGWLDHEKSIFQADHVWVSRL